MYIPIFVILVSIVATNAQVQDSRVVLIEQGPVRGYREPERNLYAFYSIPYATAPTGRDRYKVFYVMIAKIAFL